MYLPTRYSISYSESNVVLQVRQGRQGGTDQMFVCAYRSCMIREQFAWDVSHNTHMTSPLGDYIYTVFTIRSMSCDTNRINPEGSLFSSCVRQTQLECLTKLEKWRSCAIVCTIRRSYCWQRTMRERSIWCWGPRQHLTTLVAITPHIEAVASFQPIDVYVLYRIGMRPRRPRMRGSANPGHRISDVRSGQCLCATTT
jgi:hypothetical protein